MSDRRLGRSEGQEIDDWNTDYCSHIQGSMSTSARSRTLFAFITITYLRRAGRQAENFLVYSFFL